MTDPSTLTLKCKLIFVDDRTGKHVVKTEIGVQEIQINASVNSFMEVSLKGVVENTIDDTEKIKILSDAIRLIRIKEKEVRK